jgi:UDP-N-acetylmuramoyl-tripeptide--D-alanyl-D-alanine ligase
LEGFGSFEGLKKAKGEMYDYLRSRGKIFINTDNKILNALKHTQESIAYGNSKDAFCSGELISNDPFLTLNVRLEKEMLIHTKLIGSYNFENILAAACIGRYFGVKDADISEALAAYIPDNNRSQILKLGKSTIILDAYNANPTSMEHAIENFSGMLSEKKIVFLGDMFEMGSYAYDEHKRICDLLYNYHKKAQISQVFLAGKEFQNVVTKHDKYNFIKSYLSADDIISDLQESEFSDSWILIKGSRGMMMEKLVNALNIK